MLLHRRMDILREATVPELRNPTCLCAAGFLHHIRSVVDDVRVDHFRNHRISGLELQVFSLEAGPDTAAVHGDRVDSVRDSVFFH